MAQPKGTPTRARPPDGEKDLGGTVTTPPKRAPFPQWWWDQTVQTRRIIAVGVLAVLVAALWFGISALRSDGSTAGSDGQPAGESADADEQARLFVASLPPQRVATWDSLAQCESEGDWGLATGNGYYGGLQVSQTNWLEAGGDGSPHEKTREEQIMRAETIYDAQGWNAWPSCSSQLGLSG